MGALMLSCLVSHPDIEKFIDMKTNSTKVTGANISVKATDKFMESVVNNTDFDFEFDDKIVSKGDAKKLFTKLVYNAWKNAEPGLLFWDNILKESPARGYGNRFKEKSTNPLAN